MVLPMLDTASHALSTLNGITFSFADIVEIAAICFAAGGIWVTVRSNVKRLRLVEVNQTKIPERIHSAIKEGVGQLEAVYKERIERVEENHRLLQDRFLAAMENLAEKIGSLTTELRSMAATHDARLANLEEQARKE